MTAFSRQAGTALIDGMVWELRSVNHRYLEMHYRLPEPFTSLESLLRERVRKRIQRGKLDITLRCRHNPLTAGLSINSFVLNQLLSATQTIAAHTMQPCAPLDALQLLAWPGVLNQSNNDNDAEQALLLVLFDSALDDLLAMRQGEGARLAELLEQRIAQIMIEIRAIRERLPLVLERQHQKLREYVGEVSKTLDPQRLEQEMVIFAQRLDVTEELDRLETHTAQVLSLLKTGGHQGRRLDFLMQELNREANTLGSKSNDQDISHRVVEIKVYIEQMREQIQNIE